MSPRPPRICIQQWRGDCSNGGIAVAGTSRCEAHLGKTGWARYKVEHPEKAAFYRQGGWREARRLQLIREPNCAVCARPATVADHIRNRAEGGADLDPSNLQSLCDDCHRSKISAESRRGNKRAAAKRRRRR